MRRFRVWLGKNLPQVPIEYENVEMPDDATDEECDEACKDRLDSMMQNSLDMGWSEES